MAAEEAAVYKRVEADDPTCCQGLGPHGPCNIQAVPGQRFCRMHFGIGNKVAEQKATRNYRLNQYQHRINQFADGEQVKSLREEIGVLGILLESTMNKCQNDTELLLYSNKISDLVVKIEKLVASCHKLELATGSLVDKASVMFLGDVIVNIIAEVCPPDKITGVAERIMTSIMNINELPNAESASYAIQRDDQPNSIGTE